MYKYKMDAQNLPMRKPVDESEVDFDYKKYMIKALNQWWVFAISIFFCFTLGIIYLKYATPTYKIGASILVEDDKKGGGINPADFLGDVGGLLNSNSTVDNEAEILQTRFLMEQVVKDMKLNVTYYIKSTLKDVEVYNHPFIVEQVLMVDTITKTNFNIVIPAKGNPEISYIDNITNDNVNKNIVLGKPFFISGVGQIIIRKNDFLPFVPGNYAFTINPIDQTVDALQSKLTVAVPNKQVSTIDLTLENGIPKQGENILNKLIQKYIQQNIDDKNKIADSTIAFIENRLVYVSKELGGVEGRIQTFKQNGSLADISEQSKLLVGNTNEYLNKLSTIETQLSVVASVEDYLKDDSKNKRVVPSAVLPNDAVFAGLEERYNQLLLERERQSLSFTADNPIITNLDQRIASLRADMLANLASSRNSLIISRDDIKKNTGKLADEIHKVPAQERTYLDLSRQQQIKQQLYLFLLQKREETSISKTSNIANARVIDPPKSSVLPTSPRRIIILAFSLFFGFLIPMGKIYITDWLNNKIVSKEDILTHTSIPILAEISHNKSEKNIVVNNETRSIIAEQFRALRTNLGFVLNPDKPNVILITSSMSGEGKSFSAINLAVILAISGKKVVMIELDLRKPTLTAKMDMRNEVGFTNYIISNKVKADDILVPLEINENLFLISSGPIPPNPTETILNNKTASLISELKEKFDYIIIDVPPIGLVTDAQILNKYADLTIYIVRQNYTFKNQLSIAEDLYQSKKVNKIGIVVNDISLADNLGYGYGYGYGTYGTYGAYGEEAEKKSFWKRLFRK